MPRMLRVPLAVTLLFAAAGALAAQTGTNLSPSPTLPSDTLQANYAPRSAVGPMPELAPSLPSDTLKVTQPADPAPSDSLGSDSSSSQVQPDDIFPYASPVTPGDSAALRELKSWIHRHPGVTAPPPVRAVLVRA